ncbi:DMT family transporter [Roseospira navarrensis]|uniref:EamA family transporter n=1 Tax=Roseospira navarrensis TaxID=140058 RepID=A0A7X1ZF13_9PROT|nr:DMT family transporter [Roseospira navarrensis]MQX37122.1 EamA family transporter [Roseospira navarrensis]
MTSPLTRVHALAVSAVPGWRTLPGNVRGGVLMLVSAFFFTVMATLVKALGGVVPTVELVFFRFAFQAVALLPLGVLALRDDRRALMTRRPGLHALRLVFGAAAMYGGFFAVANLPLATAMSITFTRALFLTVLAVIVLRESVGPHRWGAVCVGFAGVLVILRPWDGGAIEPAMLVALGAAAAVASMSICVRLLSRTEGNLVLMLYPSLFATLLFAGPAWAVWVMPDAWTLVLLIAMSAAGGLGQVLLISAYRQAEPSAVAPINFTQLIWATLFGFVLFGEFPDAATWIGAAMILGGALYTLHRERRRRITIAAGFDRSGGDP